ncbi:MAG: flagellar filament capping protein FliD [Planctomycetota bacterium]|jgi:flagellar hook-associated protein 2|nr:flagellar filament capping protein FliD [Planctomycetota bacterium]
MAIPTQTIGGLASGMDTNNIISSLVDIQKSTLKRLETQKEKENLYLQAYYSVNSLLKEFLTSVETMTKDSMWKTKGSVSSDESVLSADVTENAIPGTYTFKVGQLASGTQYMSGGFSSMDNPVLPAGASGAKTAAPANLYSQLSTLNGGEGVNKGILTVALTDQSGNQILDINGNPAIWDIDTSKCNTLYDIMAVVAYTMQESGFNVRCEDKGDGTFAINYSPTMKAEVEVSSTYNNVGKWENGAFNPNGTAKIGGAASNNSLGDGWYSTLDGSYVGETSYKIDASYENVSLKNHAGWSYANGNSLSALLSGDTLTSDLYLLDGNAATRTALAAAATAAGADYSYHANDWGVTSDTTITTDNLVNGDGDPLELTFDGSEWKDANGDSYSGFTFLDDGGDTVTVSNDYGVWSYKKDGANADFTYDGNTHAYTAEHWEDSSGVTVDSFSFTGVDGKNYAYLAKGTDLSTATTGAGTWEVDGGGALDDLKILTAEQINALDALEAAVNSGDLKLTDLKAALQIPVNAGTTDDYSNRYDAFVAAVGGKLSSDEVSALAGMYDAMLQSTDSAAQAKLTTFDNTLNAVGTAGATAAQVKSAFKAAAIAANGQTLDDIFNANGSQPFSFYDADGVIIQADKSGGDWTFTNTGGDNVGFTFGGQSVTYAADDAGISQTHDYYQKETVVAKPEFKIKTDGYGDATWKNLVDGVEDVTTQMAPATSILNGIIQPGQTVGGIVFSGATADDLHLSGATAQTDANAETKYAANLLYSFANALDATKKNALFTALGAAAANNDATGFAAALEDAGFTTAKYADQRAVLEAVFGNLDADGRDAVATAMQNKDMNAARLAFINSAPDTNGGAFKLEWDPGLATVENKGEAGYISIENSGGQAVRNVLVNDLNGGAGIYHGSIEVVNKEGTRTTIDLSTAATLNDVLDRINGASGVGVFASINDNGDGIKLTDLTGGSGALKVYNSGLGTTAADLGLTTLDANGNGANINQLNEKTQIALLRNGMGVNDGQLGNMIVRTGDGKEYTVYAEKCNTLGDLMEAFRNAETSEGEKLSAKASISLENNKLVLSAVGKIAVRSDTLSSANNTTAEDLGLVTGNTAYQRVEGLALTSSLNSVALYNVTGKRSFDADTDLAMFGVAAGETFSVTDKAGHVSTFTAGDGDGQNGTTLGDLLEFFNDTSNGAAVMAYLEPASGTIAFGDLTNIASADAKMTLGGSAAAKLGFPAGNTETASGANALRGAQIYFAGIAGIADSFVRNNDGELTANFGAVKMLVGGAEKTLDLSGVKADGSMADLLKTLNDQASGTGVTFTLNDAKNGIAVVNASGQNVSFQSGVVTNADGTTTAYSTARDLGLTDVKIASGATGNAGNLDTKWLGRAYSLEKLTGQSATSGSISLINTRGGITTVDLTGAKTMGDVIDKINDAGSGVYASINDAGDGLLLTDTYGGQGAITVSEVGGGALAKQLGILGSSGGASHNGSFQRDIAISASDSLRDIMNKVSASGLELSASIINDGSGSSPYRLVIASKNSGAGSDFTIDTNVGALGMQQTSKGQDAVLLYGTGTGATGSTMLLSPTNANNSALLGITLNANKVSDEWTTITVKQEKQQVIEAVQTLVDSYNAIRSMVNEYSQYTYDEATKKQTKGIFFGDTNVRRLTSQMQEMFFSVTNNKSGGMSMWYDLGVKFKDDGTLTLDKETLENMVNSDYDAVYNLLVQSVNVASTVGGSAEASSSVKGSITSGATVTTTGPAAAGFSRNGAANGDNSFKSFGSGNGFMSADAIGSKGYTYEVLFDKTRTLDKVYIYHVDSEAFPADKYALKDFKVEYLNPNNNKWEELRTISDNKANANYLGFAVPTAAKGVRLVATSSNAEDNLFRLTDIQCFEPQGLASSMNQTTKRMTDIIDGWFATIQTNMEEKITKLDASITKEQTRLEDYEAGLIAKYAAMETAMSKLQAQGTSITNMANLTGGNNSK